MPPTVIIAISPPKTIRRIYLIFAPAYRHMMSPTIPIIINVPKSGIKRNTKKRSAFIVMKETKNSFSFTLLRFLSNHHPRKRTYPNLKNSAGWILGKNGMSIHPLAPLRVIPIPGMKTDN